MDLEYYRTKIDEADDALIKAFCARMEAAKEIGRIKAENGLPVLNKDREKVVIDKAVAKAPDELKEYVAKLYDTLLTVSRNYQGDK